MNTLFRLARHLLPVLLLAVLASPARAGLPDSTRFTVVLELGNVAQAQEWLEEGLPPDFVGDRIGTGLMIGAWEGNVPMMELFVRHGARVDQTNALGEQALQLAAWQGRTEAVRWLLDHGASLNRQGKQWSALHYAAFAGHTELVRLLLARGADVNAQAPNQSSVLMMAVREGHEDTVQDLLKAGADPRPANDWGDTALTWAMRYNNLKIAKMVSSAAEFAQAVKAPPEVFGTPVRSAPAPAEVSEILRQIRIARAQGQNVDDLEQALFAMAAKLRAEAAVPRPKRAPNALYITARKPGTGAGEGERAELSYGAPDSHPGTGKAGTLAASSGAGDVSEILQRMRRAQAEGKPVDDLRQALLDAVARMTK
ncbi:MAG: ankyrin repeat domain-containing protein [Rhodocyclaceae bacterium]|nr:ankyrin repeat domain-containing protein [Rhodocyclaceae bacterium]